MYMGLQAQAMQIAAPDSHMSNLEMAGTIGKRS